MGVGFDYTASSAGIGRGFATCITLESGFVTRGSGFLPEYTIGILTLDQVYPRSHRRGAPYVGAGVGLYNGPFSARTSEGGLFGAFTTYDNVTRLGRKLFAGADFTSTTIGEATLHFTGARCLEPCSFASNFDEPWLAIPTALPQRRI